MKSELALQARAIAKEACIYGFPMVDNYRVQYSYFVDRNDLDYKAPYNQLFNIPRAYTPEDKAVQTPNSDTPYSWIGLDLRTEPIVFTVPPIEKNRYWSLQLIDLYTHNFDYLGSRAGHLRQHEGRGDVPGLLRRCIRPETRRICEPLHAAVRTGPIASCQFVLVADAL